MRPFLLIVLAWISFLNSNAQRSMLVAAQESPAAWAIHAFQQGQTDLSCLLLDGAKRPDFSGSNNSESSLSLQFHTISCKLLKKESAAVQEALRFLKEVSTPVWRDRMHFALGHYFF